MSVRDPSRAVRSPGDSPGPRECQGRGVNSRPKIVSRTPENLTPETLAVASPTQIGQISLLFPPMTTPTIPAVWTACSGVSARQRLPQFELQQISQHGAVFRSSRACEPGTSFALGIHLPSARRHRVMDLEAIVVDCRPSGADLGWEVTLVFDSVTPAQESALRAAARINLHPGPFQQDGSFFGKTRRLCEPGLN
jgi:hypothetical protein